MLPPCPAVPVGPGRTLTFDITAISRKSSQKATSAYPWEYFLISIPRCQLDTRPSSGSPFRRRSGLVSCSFRAFESIPRPRLLAIPPSSYNSPNIYYKANGSAKDYPSVDPTLPQQSHLSPRSIASTDIPHSFLYQQGDADPNYVWGERTSLSRTDPPRSPRPPKVPSQSTRITRIPEPSIPIEGVYPSYTDTGGLNGAGLPIYRNESPACNVLPPLTPQTYLPSKLVKPHTDSPTCETLISLRESMIRVLYHRF